MGIRSYGVVFEDTTGEETPVIVELYPSGEMSYIAQSVVTGRVYLTEIDRCALFEGVYVPKEDVGELKAHEHFFVYPPDEEEEVIIGYTLDGKQHEIDIEVELIDSPYMTGVNYFEKGRAQTAVGSLLRLTKPSESTLTLEDKVITPEGEPLEEGRIVEVTGNEGHFHLWVKDVETGESALVDKFYVTLLYGKFTMLESVSAEVLLNEGDEIYVLNPESGNSYDDEEAFFEVVTLDGREAVVPLRSFLPSVEFEG